MFLCTETVTHVRHEKAPKTDEFICTVMDKVGWFETTAVKLEKAGLLTANVIEICIPENSLPQDICLQVGDYLIRGAVDKISQSSDLQQYKHTKVVSVADNRHGNLKHWWVTGA